MAPPKCCNRALRPALQRRWVINFELSIGNVAVGFPERCLADSFACICVVSSRKLALLTHGTFDDALHVRALKEDAQSVPLVALLKQKT